MSFFGSGTPSPPTVNQERIEMAITELDTVTDFFNRMLQSCHSKCLSTRYTDPELNKGESVCIDRCVAKFIDVQKKIGEKLQLRSNSNSSPPGGKL